MSYAAEHIFRNILHESYKQQLELPNLVHFTKYKEHISSEHVKVTMDENTNTIKDMGRDKTLTSSSQTESTTTKGRKRNVSLASLPRQRPHQQTEIEKITCW